MAKYVIDESTLQGLANAIRNVNGESKSYTPAEMIQAVTNIMESITYVLVDENGNEFPAVYVENDEVLTATANDIRLGKTAATEEGITEGTKEIPVYIAREGTRVVPNGSEFVLYIDGYDYTKLQAIFCPYNTNVDSSVAAEKVGINDKVYPVKSATAEADIIKDDSTKSINFGITNTSGVPYLIRYFTFKEEY